MKKLIALLLALSICVLCAACGGGNETPSTAADTASTQNSTDAATEAPTEAPSEASTNAATEPAVVYTNPLTGETVDAPITTRPFAVSVSNIAASLPHRGVTDADMFFESFVNGSIVRGLALYADITDVESIGSTRSARPLLIDICSHYGAFYAHAGGSDYTNEIMYQSGIDQMNVDTWDDAGYSYRDMARNEITDWEHCLFVRGAELADYVINEKGVDMSQAADASFGLTFAEDGTPEGGETANTVSIIIKYNANTKETVMVYNEETGKYEYNQYGMTMCDADTSEVESFTNVIVMYTKMRYNGGYHFADFVSGGSGYYACGGKIIPITWQCAGEDQPFTYYTLDGEVLTMGIGSSYVAITVDGAPVTFE